MTTSAYFGRLLLAPALLLSAVPARAQSPAPAEVLDPALAGADSLMAAAYPATGPGAAVIVARDGRVLMRGAYGMASLELGVPMRADHVFRVASMTKQFTAVATLMLMEEGKLSLDDDITRFFPDYPARGRRITVEHLLTHTSGIGAAPPDAGGRRDDVTTAQLIAGIRDAPMEFAPGEDWRYNNGAYVLLGGIIEQLSGQSYADFLRNRIFEPLGMHDTRYESQPVITPRRVPGYATTSDRRPRNADFLSMTRPHAAGALVSTVDDLLRWGHAVAEGRLLRRDTWTRAFTPYRMADGRGAGYAYGWFVGNLAGRSTIEHGGDIDGFSADGLWVPSERLHVYVLSNAERDYANPGDLSTRIAERVLAGGPEMPRMVIPAERLDEYVGVYQARGDETRTILRDGARLTSRLGQGAPREIRPLGGDEFMFPAAGRRATFVRGADGRVVGVRTRARVGPEAATEPRTTDTPTPGDVPEGGILLAPEVLDRYVGEYEFGPGQVLTVGRAESRLVGRMTGQGPATFMALTETRFQVLEVEAVIEFQRDLAGTVTGLVLSFNGEKTTVPRTR